MAKLASFRTTKASSVKAPHTRLKRVSGNAIGSRSKKIIACEQCNFMVIHSPASKTTNPNPESKPGDFLPGSKFKTGDKCPRCSGPFLRLFDSQAEFGRAQELKILKSKGYVTDLRYQVAYPLTCNNKVVAKYIADFVYFDTLTGNEVVEDVKPKGGLVTDVFILKKAMFEACYDRPIAIVER
jgi:hypothetical protein